MPQYTFHRVSLAVETFVITAPDENTARDQLDHNPDRYLVGAEWLDWHDPDWELTRVQDELEIWLRAGIKEKSL